MTTKLRTLREVAAYLRRHPDSVRSLVDSGELEAINCGTERRRVWCFTEEAVQEFVSRRTHKAERQHAMRAMKSATKRLDQLLAK
jgi:excisionase family DNA binding protein